MSEPNPFYLDTRKIQEFLPHRYPFLMVDRVLEITGPGALDEDSPKSKMGIKVKGVKNVTMNEPYFTGHFPDLPIMPGVQIIEAMAQVASFSIYPTFMKRREEFKEGFQCFLVGVDKARFRSPVTPGDVLVMETEVTLCRSTMWGFKTQATVDGKLVAEATIMANIILNKTGAKTVG
jgi:3-hydroxyacyl-[acyl-carrier-protein] dehydratase